MNSRAKISVALSAILAAIAGLGATGASGSDRPMWRGDARRSGTAAEDPPARTHVQRVQELPPAAPTGLPPTSAAQADAPAGLEELLEPIRAEHKLPALAGAVILDARLGALGAVGVRKADADVPVTRDDQFHVGSCTKAMTATLIALLVEEGKLDWDAPLSKALPDLADRMDPNYHGVTLRHLLCHRGGLVPNTPPGRSFGEFFRLPGTEVEQRLAYVRRILRAPPRAKPGEQYVYSNAGYAVAAALAERATQRPWQELMRKRLFEPLGMASAGFGAMGRPGRIDQPYQHVWKDGTCQPIGPGPMSDNPLVIAPAGAVHCSLPDWAKFVASHMAGPRGRDCPVRLRPETWRTLHSAPFEGNYAMGWVVAARDWGGGLVLTHAGSNTMNYAVIWMAPRRDFAALVATNVGGDGAAKACDAAAAAMIRKFLPPATATAPGDAAN